MAAALSLAMPKEAFDQFLADTYGIDGQRDRALWVRQPWDGHGGTRSAQHDCSPSQVSRLVPREKLPQARGRRNFFFVDYLPTLALRAASGRA